jgi:hypothetical protein
MTPRGKLLGALFVASLVCVAGTARAQEPAAATIAHVVRLNREGVALYQKGEVEAARRALKEALDLCETAGLDRHPVAARTHVHMGIVVAGGFGDKEIARRQFEAALAIAPDITLTPGLAWPEAQQIFDEAAALGSAPARPAPASAAQPFATEPEADDRERPKPIPNTRTADVFRVETRAARRAREAKERLEKGGQDDQEDEDDEVPGGRLRLEALVGAGTGWASGFGDVNVDTPVAGSFAATKLDHVVAEVGYALSRTWTLSLRGRFQWISGPTVLEAQGRTYAPAAGALAGFGAATWSPETGRVRPYLSAALGAGRIRHVVTLSALGDCGAARNETCVDTVRSGPFFGAASAGVTVDVADHLALVVGATAGLASGGAPFNLDLDAGIALHL